MSLDATRWAWRQAGVRSSDKFVLLSLADRADEAHRCYPSIQRLAADTLLDRKTVMAALTRLETAGLLRSEKRLGHGNFYALLGVEDRHPTSTKNGTGSARSRGENGAENPTENARELPAATSPENGTPVQMSTSTKNGTPPVPKTGRVPVPKTGHESTIESTTNLKSEDSCADAQVSAAPDSGVRPTAAPTCPHREIIALYHEILPELQGVLVERWDGQRAKDLATRWRESPKHQVLAFWRWYFGQVRKRRFYLGENDRGWRADLGWLLKARNFTKILEAAVSAQQRRVAA